MGWRVMACWRWKTNKRDCREMGCAIMLFIRFLKTRVYAKGCFSLPLNKLGMLGSMVLYLFVCFFTLRVKNIRRMKIRVMRKC
jgi:hypothetical protein